VILLQLATITGFTILASIISGQSLSAAVGGGLNLNVGIVITAVIGLVVSFMGYKVLHLYERYSWVPTLIALVITLGVGGNNLHLQQTTAVPSARTILSFGSIVISFTTAWTCLVSDFSVYISPEVPR
jgi:purine-cytosine permease-like protein